MCIDSFNNIIPCRYGSCRVSDIKSLIFVVDQSNSVSGSQETIEALSKSLEYKTENLKLELSHLEEGLIEYP